jgi:hypothetical protein
MQGETGKVEKRRSTQREVFTADSVTLVVSREKDGKTRTPDGTM